MKRKNCALSRKRFSSRNEIAVIGSWDEVLSHRGIRSSFRATITAQRKQPKGRKAMLRNFDARKRCTRSYEAARPKLLEASVRTHNFGLEHASVAVHNDGRRKVACG